jgi:hypothetical protein
MGQRELGRKLKPDIRADGGKVGKTDILEGQKMLSDRQKWKTPNDHERQLELQQTQARQRVVLEGAQEVQEAIEAEHLEQIQQMRNNGHMELAQQMERWVEQRMANRGRQMEPEQL